MEQQASLLSLVQKTHPGMQSMAELQPLQKMILLNEASSVEAASENDNAGKVTNLLLVDGSKAGDEAQSAKD